MIKQVLFITFSIFTLSFVCDKPQQNGWLTFDALSARDDVTKVFQDINTKITKSDSYNTTVNGTQYIISDLTGQTYYSDTFQKDTFINDQTANVSGGVTTLAIQFNYNFNNTSGLASGHLIIDDFWFSKKLQSRQGFLTWSPVQINNLTLTSSISISSSTPKLSDTAKLAYEQIINNHAHEQNRLKQNLINEINTLYKSILTESLHNEDITSISNLVYTYKNVNFTYTKNLHSYKLQNSSTFKGLYYDVMYQLENTIKNCSDLPTSFNQSFGGVQSHNGFSWIQSTFKYAAQKGLFNTDLGPAWENNMFQFYMGDVANVIQHAENFPPSKPVTGKCEANLTAQLLVTRHDSSTIGALIPYVCKLYMDNNTLIQTITFSASFFVQLSLSSEYLITHVGTAIAGYLNFIKQGDFVVTNQGLASQLVKNALNSLVKSNTVGNKYPSVRRNRGAINLNESYLTMFDPSEM